ncbi:hypothetical protein FHS42_002124 [Streptomyces zagrosensis]|uniref:Uncharacterized protein n=1 Tax=Streptomyces zagrosensis TaxID=1042984 RepID=A0A7W9Q7J7_9ACTN|nr:hypothetical protein [Streptomyces zagrosensis]
MSYPVFVRQTTSSLGTPGLPVVIDPPGPSPVCCPVGLKGIVSIVFCVR